jgi:DNA adenine methylase
MGTATQPAIDPAVASRPKRPALRYMGGKWILAPWIICHFPAHRLYVEPFGGAASVLLRKPRSFIEIYNDIDGDVVNLFRVLRDPASSDRLRSLLLMTPFARDEFAGAYDVADEPIEKARRLVVRSFMGYGSNAYSIHHRTGFRIDSTQKWTSPSGDWSRWPAEIEAFCSRLQGVSIENIDALALIRRVDAKESAALYYVDPPYPRNTRSSLKDRYTHEFNQHAELAELLHQVQGAVVLSSYPCASDDQLYRGWKRFEKSAYAEGARKRTECLLLNPKAVAGLETHSPEKRSSK